VRDEDENDAHDSIQRRYISQKSHGGLSSPPPPPSLGDDLVSDESLR